MNIQLLIAILFKYDYQLIIKKREFSLFLANHQRQKMPLTLINTTQRFKWRVMSSKGFDTHALTKQKDPSIQIWIEGSLRSAIMMDA